MYYRSKLQGYVEKSAFYILADWRCFSLGGAHVALDVSHREHRNVHMVQYKHGFLQRNAVSRKCSYF